jgi:hypothetical protein
MSSYLLILISFLLYIILMTTTTVINLIYNLKNYLERSEVIIYFLEIFHFMYKIFKLIFMIEID